MATGGFSTKNISIEHYRSPFIEYAITFFMFVAGANFSLHYQFLKGNFRALGQDPEFRFYSGVVLLATLLITVNLLPGLSGDVLKAFRLAIFQVVSIQTTTGYSSVDFEKWPAFSQYVLLALMFIGGCAGSTGGAIKCIRIYVLIKEAARELYRLVHPHAVAPVKLAGKVLSQDTLNGIRALFFLYIGIFLLASLAVSFLGADIITSVSAVATTLGNTGPGLGEVGPLDNFAHLPAASKWILTACMLFGRLEIYTLLILLFPEFWRK
jgi:trk system potassium uptake protein TrkH